MNDWMFGSSYSEQCFVLDLLFWPIIFRNLLDLTQNFVKKILTDALRVKGLAYFYPYLARSHQQANTLETPTSNTRLRLLMCAAVCIQYYDAVEYTLSKNVYDAVSERPDLNIQHFVLSAICSNIQYPHMDRRINIGLVSPYYINIISGPYIALFERLLKIGSNTSSAKYIRLAWVLAGSAMHSGSASFGGGIATWGLVDKWRHATYPLSYLVGHFVAAANSSFPPSVGSLVLRRTHLRWLLWIDAWHMLIHSRNCP